jgi:cell division transport system permease protein
VKTWLQQHLQAARYALSRLFKTPIGSLLSALVIGIALALPAGGHLALQTFLGLSRNLSATPEISLFMRLDASPEELAEVRTHLERHPDLERLEFVSREVAYQRLHAAEGLAAVLESLPRNPFPDGFIATPRIADPETFTRLQKEWAALPKVDFVQLDSAWVTRLHALLKFGEGLILILAGVLSGALVVVTFNTIRLQIVTHRPEIDVARLLGATDRFIRRPLYWFGVMQGALGGLLACLIVASFMALLEPALHSMAQAWGLDFSLRGLDLPTALCLLLLSATLGWVGTALSVRQYLGKI